jgi:chromosome segregation ATPase
MSVIFNSFDVIEIDGIASGNIVDVISNHAPRRAEVLAAYGVYVAAINAEKATLTTDLATANASIATLTSEKTSLTTQLEAKTTDLATRTTELSEKVQLLNSGATVITGLESQVTSLTTDKTTLTTRKEELQSEVLDLLAQIDTLNTKVAFLNSIRTYDSNQIRSLAFYDRITKDQINKLGLLAIDDPQAAEIHKLLNAYKDNPWPVLLDDPLVVGGIQYLLYIEIITQQEAAQITRPASREEAYFAP